MNYRKLGRTGLMVSEIGFGGEWLERHEEQESIELIRYAESQGINIIDCWMPDPKSRSIIGKAIRDSREKWFVQGHIGSTYQDGQYVRSRDLKYVIPAFQDLMERIGGGYIDLGMIHYIDSEEDWERAMNSEFIDYVLDLHDQGLIRHIGMSTHNPKMAIRAAKRGLRGFRDPARRAELEMVLFSVNPAFDMRPGTDCVEELFGGYEEGYAGIDPERAEFYRLAEEKDIGITVMKGYFGGALLDPERSPFGVAFTPAQCIHYALTRPGVRSVLVGYDTIAQIDAAVSYETDADDEKDYASVLANAPMHSYKGTCTYCGHCRPCVMNIDIAMVNKFYDLGIQQPKVPASVQAHYEALGITAASCIGCRDCESRCPFEVPIAERMEKALALFGC
ncbi:MAG: aldo/keto reductase [Lachnospiraceae bacterium]|nr:aldo/keto reductase [Lachnospiraceae bacterium]